MIWLALALGNATCLAALAIGLRFGWLWALALFVAVPAVAILTGYTLLVGAFLFGPSRRLCALCGSPAAVEPVNRRGPLCDVCAAATERIDQAWSDPAPAPRAYRR